MEVPCELNVAQEPVQTDVQTAAPAQPEVQTVAPPSVLIATAFRVNFAAKSCQISDNQTQIEFLYTDPISTCSTPLLFSQLPNVNLDDVDWENFFDEVMIGGSSPSTKRLKLTF